jgi:ketosteroid isomerase-like protein
MTIEEKVEVARRIFEELSHKAPEAAIEFMDPDVKFDFTRSRGPNRGMFVGRSEVLKQWRDFLGAWAEWVSEPYDFIEVAGDEVLFSIKGRMTGRDGIELTIQAAHIWTIRDGLVARATFFQTREDALRTAGLTGQGGSS